MDGVVPPRDRASEQVARSVGAAVPAAPSTATSGAAIDQSETAEGRGNALYWAAGAGQSQVVRQLLMAGASLDKARIGKHTALHIAAERGHVFTIEILLSFGAKASERDEHGQTALHLAAKGSHVDALRLLLVGDVSLFINLADEDGVTALHWAALNGPAAAVTKLLQRDALANAETTTMETPLHWAARCEDPAVAPAIVKSLVGKKATIDPRRRDSGMTPLHVACSMGNVAAVMALLDAGAMVNVGDNNERSALHLACIGNHVSTVEVLLSRKAQVDLVDRRHRTALHHASAAGHAACVAVLISAFAVVDAQCQDNMTPLLFACINNADNGPLTVEKIERLTDTIGSLLNAGAQIHMVERASGKSPLHFVSQYGMTSAAKLLVDRGASMDARCNGLQTPLHYASSRGHATLATYLLRRGADVLAVDKHGRTALHFARMFNQPEIVQLLLDHGANLEALDNAGNTPLMAQGPGEGTEAILMLLRHGANGLVMNRSRMSFLDSLSSAADRDVAASTLTASRFVNMQLDNVPLCVAVDGSATFLDLKYNRLQFAAVGALAIASPSCASKLVGLYLDNNRPLSVVAARDGPQMPLFTSLQHLSLAHCGLQSKDLVFLAGCTTLRSLDITGNYLEGLPNDLGRLVNIRRLVASECVFSNFPLVILQLHQLRSLDVSRNPLNRLPAALAIMNNLTYLQVADCPLALMPIECRYLDGQGMLAFLRDLHQSKQERMYNARVVLLGAQGAGKSSVLHALCLPPESLLKRNPKGGVLGGKQWQERLCELRGTAFIYYRPPTRPGGPVEESGTIDLMDATVNLSIDNDVDFFILRSAHSHGDHSSNSGGSSSTSSSSTSNSRAVHFRCASEVDRARWWVAMRFAAQAATRSNTTGSDPSSSNGDSNGDSYKEPPESVVMRKVYTGAEIDIAIDIINGSKGGTATTPTASSRSSSSSLSSAGTATTSAPAPSSALGMSRIPRGASMTVTVCDVNRGTDLDPIAIPLRVSPSSIYTILWDVKLVGPADALPLDLADKAAIVANPAYDFLCRSLGALHRRLQLLTPARCASVVICIVGTHSDRYVPALVSKSRLVRFCLALVTLAVERVKPNVPTHTLPCLNLLERSDVQLLRNQLLMILGTRPFVVKDLPASYAEVWRQVWRWRDEVFVDRVREEYLHLVSSRGALHEHVPSSSGSSSLLSSWFSMGPQHQNRPNSIGSDGEDASTSTAAQTKVATAAAAAAAHAAAAAAISDDNNHGGPPAVSPPPPPLSDGNSGINDDAISILTTASVSNNSVLKTRRWPVPVSLLTKDVELTRTPLIKDVAVVLRALCYLDTIGEVVHCPGNRTAASGMAGDIIFFAPEWLNDSLASLRAMLPVWRASLHDRDDLDTTQLLSASTFRRHELFRQVPPWRRVHKSKREAFIVCLYELNVAMPIVLQRTSSVSSAGRVLLPWGLPVSRPPPATIHSSSSSYRELKVGSALVLRLTTPSHSSLCQAIMCEWNRTNVHPQLEIDVASSWQSGIVLGRSVLVTWDAPTRTLLLRFFTAAAPVPLVTLQSLLVGSKSAPGLVRSVLGQGARFEELLVCPCSHCLGSLDTIVGNVSLLGHTVSLYEVKASVMAVRSQQVAALQCQHGPTGELVSIDVIRAHLAFKLIDQMLTDPLLLQQQLQRQDVAPLEATLRRAWLWADDWIGRKKANDSDQNNSDRDVYEDTLMLALWGAVVAARIFQTPFLDLTAGVDLAPLSRLTLEILQHMAQGCRDKCASTEQVEQRIMRVCLRPDVTATVQLLGAIVQDLADWRFADGSSGSVSGNGETYSTPVRSVLELRLMDIYELHRRGLPDDDDLIDRAIALAYCDATAVVQYILNEDGDTAIADETFPNESIINRLERNR